MLPRNSNSTRLSDLACAFALLVLLTVGAPDASAGVSGPVVRLFPTTVLEDIRETGQVAEDMENNLQEVINKLDMQQQLYTESLCQGADGDQGCERIAKQLGSTYLEMLDIPFVFSSNGDAFLAKFDKRFSKTLADG